jgi:hypothetical protein
MEFLSCIEIKCIMCHVLFLLCLAYCVCFYIDLFYILLNQDP